MTEIIKSLFDKKSIQIENSLWIWSSLFISAYLKLSNEHSNKMNVKNNVVKVLKTLQIPFKFKCYSPYHAGKHIHVFTKHRSQWGGLAYIYIYIYAHPPPMVYIFVIFAIVKQHGTLINMSTTCVFYMIFNKGGVQTFNHKEN
jgi:hypothetical protein